MTDHKGIIAAIVCPMLEDELLYSITSDPEEKTIYLVDNKYAGSIKRKIDKKKIPHTLIDEHSFFNKLYDVDENGFTIAILMNDLGLHAEPKDLKEKIEEQVIMMQGKADVLALYYGTCGTAMWDITKWAKEKGLSMPVLVFRDESGIVCDDCVGVAVGGTKRYLDLLKAHTGQLFLTPAMAMNWEDFMESSDMLRGQDHYDKETMRWIFEMCGYQYAVKLDTGLADEEEYTKCANQVTTDMNLKLIDAEPGWVTLYPANRIYNDAKQALVK